MTERLLDFIITKVYEGKSGKGKYGPWTAYNFYTDKTGKEKFSYFWGEGKTILVNDMRVAYMEYEVKQDGQYTNLNVKKLELPEGTKSIAIPNEKEDMGSPNLPNPATNKDRGVYTSYANDLAIAILNSGGNLETADLDSMVLKIAKSGKTMMNEALSNGEISPQVNKTDPSLHDQADTGDRPSEEDTGVHIVQAISNQSARIDCPNLTDDEGNPKNILKRACQTCSQREGCPAL